MTTGYITTDGSDRYHTGEDCPAFQAGRRGSQAQGHAPLPVRAFVPGEARSGCPECVSGEGGS